MTRNLDALTLHTRFRDFGMTAHTQVTSLMFSGIFALGAFALLDILRTPDQRILRLSWWLIATAAETRSLLMQMQRPILMGRSFMSDVPVLALRGLLAMTGYALITPQYGGHDGWRFGYLLLILLVGCGWWLARSFLRGILQSRFPAELQTAVEAVISDYRQERRVLPPLAAVYLCISGVLLLAPVNDALSEALVIGFNLLMFGAVLLSNSRTQQNWTALENRVADLADVQNE